MEKTTFSKVRNLQSKLFPIKENKEYFTEVIPFVRSVLSFINAPFVKVLDVGCGSAQLDRMFPFPNFYIGIDFLNVENYVKEKERRAIIGDALFLPFINCSFDVVILYDVIEYTVNYTLAIREAARVVKKNGILGISIHESNDQIIKEIKKVCNILHVYNLCDERSNVMAITKSNAGNVLSNVPIETYAKEEVRSSKVEETTGDIVTQKEIKLPPLAWDSPEVVYAEHAAVSKMFDTERSEGMSKALSMLSDHVKDKKILDFGCGSGIWAVKLFPLVKSYLGVDGSKEVVNTAESYAVNFKPKCKFSYMRLDQSIPTDFRFIGEPYDIVLMLNFLRHVDPVYVEVVLQNVLCKATKVIVFDCYGIEITNHNENDPSRFKVKTPVPVWNKMRTLVEIKGLFEKFFTIVSVEDVVENFSSGNNSYKRCLHILEAKAAEL